MKRFFTISILAAIAIRSMACLWVDNHNSYLFYACDKDDFKERTHQLTVENWKAYLGLGSDDYFGFDAEEVAAAAREKGDQLMVSYAQQLQRYLDCVDVRQREQYEWNYPTQQERQQMQQTLRQVRTYAQGKLTSRLRSQHALLFMRCNMLLGNNGENVTFYEQTASKFIESVYKEMMLNIYAGALMKTGRGDRAGQIFAEQGDYESLMTQYYKRRSYQAISQEYERDPQSAVLPFLLQDFVNNAQEAADGDGMGKLFVRSLTQQEVEQMITLCSKAVREQKTQHPAMWQTAKAWMEFLFGKQQMAVADIQKATTMTDEQHLMDNARTINLYINAATQPLTQQNEEFIVGEMEWLQSVDGRQRSLDRLVHQALEPKLRQAGRTNTLLAMMKKFGYWEYSAAIDSLSPQQMQAFIDYARQPSQLPLDRHLKQQDLLDASQLADMMGTKHLRLCQWEEALEWLRQVPTAYYENRGYAVYAAKRRYDVEPWITRQWVDFGLEYSGDTYHLDANPKAAFAQEMQKMEKELKKLKGQKRQQRCYDLAVRYAQASITGDCWFLTHDGKSVYDTDYEERPNEVDFHARARDLLREAAQSSDFQLRERALFALGYVYLNEDRWFDDVWNSRQGVSVRVANKDASQYQAFAALFAHEQQGSASSYVQRCDEYQQFTKAFRR